MGKFTIRLPDGLESKINEDAANLGITKSAYIRKALKGERDTQKELNRATVEDEIEQLGKRIYSLEGIIKGMLDELVYMSDYQRELLKQVAMNVNGKEAGSQVIHETNKAMRMLYGEEATKDDELSCD